MGDFKKWGGFSINEGDDFEMGEGEVDTTLGTMPWCQKLENTCKEVHFLVMFRLNAYLTAINFRRYEILWGFFYFWPFLQNFVPAKSFKTTKFGN